MGKFYKSVLLAAMMAVLFAVGTADAGDTDNGAESVDALNLALGDLDQWIGEEANGQKWRKFLATDKLREFIAQGHEADPAKVVRVLEKYRSDVSGLEKPRFAQVRTTLEAWIVSLMGQYSDDLAKMAWASRGDYDPTTMEGRLEELRSELKSRAEQLEKELGTNTEFAQNWKQYLRWELLTAHLGEDVKVSREMLVSLDRVLRRFRANRPGLELPIFLETTTAISNYRGVYSWYETVQQIAKRSRKKYSPADLERRVYTLQMLGLQKTLSHHQEASTVETARKIGETLGLIEHLRQSPQLVAALRGRYSEPNVATYVSEATINEFARRPVDETQPVRDVILGARIRGTAHSTGEVEFATLQAEDHVGLEVQITGNIHSNTTGFKKPVLITSQGNTSFYATKQLKLSDEQFLTMPACTSASTDNSVCDICKTGGNFGRRLIEKIAWKKVRESQSQSESIAARHAEQKVSAKFDKQISEVIYQARANYEEKVRTPLVRTGMFPEELNFSSTDSSVNVQTKLASYEQVSTDLPAIDFEGDGDFSLKVHETAVNNFLPTLLGGLLVHQESEAEPPQIKGDVPPWLKELAEKKNQEREETLEEEQAPATPAKESEEGEESVAFEFKPFSIQLNNAYPLSVSFDDQKLSVRIRVAELKTFEDGEETIRNDWDFLVTYAVVQDGNQVTLRRDGDVETFPLGFDPRWDKKLTGEQVATRGALAKILNKRSAEGKGFPEEINLPQVEIPRPDETKIVPVLQQIYCDGGWLALSYQLPD